MKKILIAVTILFIICGCAKREDIPKYVVENVKKYMAEEYNVEVINYSLIKSEDEVSKYGIGNPYVVDQDMYYYNFKTTDFDFNAYSNITYGAISYKNQHIFTNISAVVYSENMDNIKKIAQKYNIKIEDNLNLNTLSLENKLTLDFSYKSKETIENFTKEMLNISDIKKLVNLKYDMFEKDDGSVSFSVSGYDESMIYDYSFVEGYYDTDCSSCNSLLSILARKYYK